MKTDEVIKILENNPLTNFYKKEEHVAQWYWCKDWNNEWAKAYYMGPKEEWMTPIDKE